MAMQRLPKEGQTEIGNATELTEFIPGLGESFYHSTWSSTEAFAKHVRSLDKDKAWHDGGWEPGSVFSGTDNMKEALDLAENGWKEGAEKLERLIKTVHTLNPIVKRDVKFAIAGSIPDVPRAIAGNILNMRAPDTTKSRRRPIITLVCNMCSNWTINADVITNRAAALAALIDRIEIAGFSCEVISTAMSRGPSFTRGTGFSAVTSILVKRSNQQVDITRLAFSLGHASMFRRLIFADWGSDKGNEDRLGYGFGRVGPMDNTEAHQERGIYVVPSANENREAFETIDKAAKEGIEWLIKSLKEQGCPAFGKIDKEALVLKKETDDD